MFLDYNHGLFQLFQELNKNIYTYFTEFPSYVGASIVGFLYGMLFAIFINFLGKHILRFVFYGGFSLWLLSVTNCIKISKEEIRKIFGIDKLNLYSFFHEIFTLYTIEFFSFLISFLIIYIMLKKYAD